MPPLPTATEAPEAPESRFVAAFERLDGHMLNGASARLRGLRRAAIEEFARLGLPDRKDEAWKYTNIGKALRHAYRLHPAPAPDLAPEAVAPLRIPGLDAHVFVLVNGRYSEALSAPGDLPRGVVVTGLAQAAETHTDLFERHFGRYADAAGEAFTALNTAFTVDGLFLYVPKGTVIEKPVHVIHVLAADEDLMVQPRHLFVADEGAVLRMVETGHALTDAKTFTNAVTEFFVGTHANVDHYKVQNEGPSASQVNTMQVYQDGTSVFSTNTLTLGGEVVRNTLGFLPDAEHCETHLRGLFLGRGRMHVDTHTLVDHARPNCFSNELYKGILDDASTGVFNGKVYVRRDAQQTNAYQSNKTIVLTEQARMFSKPELEIYADDVKCSHGATTGQLDREALFYLRARGIPERQARAMLLVAFARDVIDTIKIEPLRAMLDHIIAERFAQ